MNVKPPLRRVRRKPVDPRSDRMLDVLQQFRLLLGSMKAHYRRIEALCGIGGAQLWALAEIDAAPGMQPGELARRMAIHRSTSSNLINRLEALALIRKARSADDRRVVRLYIAPGGKHVLKKAPRPFAGVLQQALARLTRPELGKLHASLAHVIRVMRVKDLKARATPLADL